MKYAKTLVALLFSAVLMAGQFSFASPAPAADGPGKACCGKHCCCTSSDQSESVPQPATPTRTISQNDWQLIAAVAQHFLRNASTIAEPILSSHTSFVAANAVPLYQRNCTFLI